MPIPSRSERTIWEVFEEERPKLIAYRSRFDSFHSVPASVSKLCLVRFDNNHYSVNASAVGRAVEIQTYADRVVIRQDGRVVAEHPRKFGRGETAYDPWHYVPVLARKPGALRNGVPFEDWVLPAALDRVRRKLAGSNDGDRQMVKILAAVRSDGLSEVEAACGQALAEGVHSADVVLNILARRRQPPVPAPDRHAGVAGASPTADRRLRPLRQPQERLTVERTEILDMMGELKLFGMRLLTTRRSRPRSSAATSRSASSAICCGPRSRKSRPDQSSISSPSPSCRSPRTSTTSPSKERRSTRGSFAISPAAASLPCSVTPCL